MQAVHGPNASWMNLAFQTFAYQWSFLGTIVSMMSGWPKPMVSTCLCLCGGHIQPEILVFWFGRKNQRNLQDLKGCCPYWAAWRGPSTKSTITNCKRVVIAFALQKLVVTGLGIVFFLANGPSLEWDSALPFLQRRKVWTPVLCKARRHFLDSKHPFCEWHCRQWLNQTCEPAHPASEFWCEFDPTLPTSQLEPGIALDVKWCCSSNFWGDGLLGRPEFELGSHCRECLGWLSSFLEGREATLFTMQVHNQDDFQAEPRGLTLVQRATTQEFWLIGWRIAPSAPGVGILMDPEFLGNGCRDTHKDFKQRFMISSCPICAWLWRLAYLGPFWLAPVPKLAEIIFVKLTRAVFSSWSTIWLSGFLSRAIWLWVIAALASCA